MSKQRVVIVGAGHNGLISGSGTNPTGGIAGTPGRLAAHALLADQDHR